jgi:hypothetical protein
MKFITFIIALLLFAVGVYFLVKADYGLSIALMVTTIAFLNVVDHSPQP